MMWGESRRTDDAVTALLAELSQTHAALAGVRAQKEMLAVQAATAQTHVEWLRARVNALEAERASLLQRLLGGAIGAPVIQPIPSGPSPARGEQADAERETLGKLEAIFEDMGDDHARAYHLDHDAAGQVVQR